MIPLQRRMTPSIALCLVLLLSGCGDGADPVVWPVAGAPRPDHATLRPTATSSMVLIAPDAPLAAHSTTPADDCGCTEVPQNSLSQGLRGAQFASLRAVLQYVGWSVESLEAYVSAHRLTVLAPNDAALAAWARELTGRPDASVVELLQPAHQPFLSALIEYHLLGARFTAADWAGVAQVYSVLPGGGPLTVTPGRPALQGPARFELFDGSARRIGVVQFDGAVGDGVLHEVDRVLMPRTLCFIGHPYVGPGDPRRVFSSWAAQPICAQPSGVGDAPVPPSFMTPRYP